MPDPVRPEAYLRFAVLFQLPGKVDVWSHDGFWLVTKPGPGPTLLYLSRDGWDTLVDSRHYLTLQEALEAYERENGGPPGTERPDGPDRVGPHEHRLAGSVPVTDPPDEGD